MKGEPMQGLNREAGGRILAVCLLICCDSALAQETPATPLPASFTRAVAGTQRWYHVDEAGTKRVSLETQFDLLWGPHGALVIERGGFAILGSDGPPRFTLYRSDRDETVRGTLNGDDTVADVVGHVEHGGRDNLGMIGELYAALDDMDRVGLNLSALLREIELGNDDPKETGATGIDFAFSEVTGVPMQYRKLSVDALSKAWAAKHQRNQQLIRKQQSEWPWWLLMSN
ncbi:MAG TPA: hypothetical protein VGE52_21370 [Pirellulales bacterium]